jgi:hypothetical protein
MCEEEVVVLTEDTELWMSSEDDDPEDDIDLFLLTDGKEEWL